MKKPRTKIRMSELHERTSAIARRAHGGERFEVSYNSMPWIEIGPPPQEVTNEEDDR